METKIAEQTEALRVADKEEDRLILLQSLKEAQEELAWLRHEAKRIPVRDIYVKDHPLLLQDALVTTQKRRLIISPWIRAKVVNHDFLKKLEMLLQRSVSIFIGFGTSEQKDNTENMFPHDQLALEKLRQLADKYPSFRLKRLGNTHAKVLLKDSEFVAVSSFN